MDFLSYMPARGCGKMTYMLQHSAYYNAPILVRSAAHGRYLFELAQFLDINIPEPIVIPPKPIVPEVDFDNELWVKTLLGKPLMHKDYFVKIYKLEEDDEKTF